MKALPQFPASRPGPLPGQVYLVGAGPGDPELLTLRGACLVAPAHPPHAGCTAVHRSADNAVGDSVDD